MRKKLAVKIGILITTHYVHLQSIHTIKIDYTVSQNQVKFIFPYGGLIKVPQIANLHFLEYIEINTLIMCLSCHSLTLHLGRTYWATLAY